MTTLSRNSTSNLILARRFRSCICWIILTEKNLRFQLPEGSRVMETGGYKNRSRSLPKAELHALIHDASEFRAKTSSANTA